MKNTMHSWGAAVGLVMFASAISQIAAAQGAGEVVVGSVDGTPLLAAPISTETARAIFAFRNQRRPDGASDDQVIAQYQQEFACSRLKTAITQAAIDKEIRRYGIGVSDAEAEEAWREQLSHVDVDAMARNTREDAAVVLSALSAVYDSGQDPDSVFRDYLATHGVDRRAWDVYLEQGRDKEWRTQFALRTSVTSTSIASALETMKPVVAQQKLDAAIDQELSTQDSYFRTYLNESRVSEVKRPDGTVGLLMAAEPLQYLRDKRDQWWKARYAQLRVVLNDPAAAQACRLDSLGLLIQGSAGH